MDWSLYQKEGAHTVQHADERNNIISSFPVSNFPFLLLDRPRLLPLKTAIGFKGQRNNRGGEGLVSRLLYTFLCVTATHVMLTFARSAHS